MTINRTHEEIVERIREIEKSGLDMFGAERTDLVQCLPAELANEFLAKPVTDAEWEVATEEVLREQARAYLSFALGKATGHRGLSASRSLNHYRAWVWLLAPEKFDDFDHAPYAQYGVPGLRIAARALGLESEWDEFVADRLRVGSQDVINMAAGKPCQEGCQEGCAR